MTLVYGLRLRSPLRSHFDLVQAQKGRLVQDAARALGKIERGESRLTRLAI